MAQNSAFVSGFFKGIATKTSFSNLVTSLYFIYTAMEQAFDETSEGGVKSLDNPELRRVPSLEKDMEYFYGSDWKSKISPSASTRLYVARVKEVAEKEPHLLVAHQYTRYLGDLFGGQMMGGMAIRSLGLESKQGVAFYNFDDISNKYDFITAWYQRLNDLDLTDEQRQAIVDEANLVFDLNIGILEELDGSPLRAMFLLTVNTLKMKLGLVS
jgi:heme oxygenase